MVGDGLLVCVVSVISLFVNSVGVFLFFYLWLLNLVYLCVYCCFDLVVFFVVCCFDACCLIRCGLNVCGLRLDWL